MGLDVHFFKIKKNKDIKSQDDIQANINPKIHQILYFRKVYFILSYFDYVDNRSYLELNKDKVNYLIDIGSGILDADDDDTKYRLIQHYFPGEVISIKELEQVISGFIENLLKVDWENESVYLWCWW